MQENQSSNGIPQKGELVEADRALGANIMSWSDLFLLLGLSTGSILLWGWFDTHTPYTKNSTLSIDILVIAYGACALYLMRRRDKNLDADFQSIEKTNPGISLYAVRSIIVIAMLSVGFIVTIFVNAFFCYTGYCIII